MKKIFVGQKEKFNFEREHGKMYYAVIREKPFVPLSNSSKKFRKQKALSLIILARLSPSIAIGSSLNHSPK